MNIKKYISILIVLAILIASVSGTYAADDDKTVIELRIGSSQVSVNGSYSNIADAPYISNNNVMIPLEWLADTIGAEVNKTGDGSETIIYGGNTEEITIGQTGYKMNNEEKTMTVAPVQKNNSTMVPLDFISSCFPITATSDLTSGNVKLVLEDDGALSDLSFLTGGISTPKIGNSYYGWSLSVPSGSRVISNSSKSDAIQVANEGRGLYFEIKVENKNGRTLTQFSDQIKDQSSVETSNINLKAKIPYFEYSGESDYYEPIRVKVLDKGAYFYSITLGCYDESVSAKKLMSDKYYTDILNSFDLNYKGNEKDIQDLSKVVNGKYSFYNYISLESRSKYLPWSTEIPAKWSHILIDRDDLTTFLGIDTKHYVQVTIDTLGESSLDSFVTNIKKGYDRNFSPKAYSFISAGEKRIADADAKNLRFKIKQAGKTYIIDEYYFQKGALVYEISVKLPENEFSKGEAEYINSINNMSFYSENEDTFVEQIGDYKDLSEGERVSENDKLFNYVNAKYNWSFKIPGYWTDSSILYSSQFSNPNSNAFIIVGAMQNSVETRGLSDTEKLSILGLSTNIPGYKQTSKNTTSEKGTKVRNYTYRIEDEEQDLYGTAQFHIFEKGSYSYCFMSFMPDLTATDKAVKEVNDIWKSFTINK